MLLIYYAEKLPLPTNDNDEFVFRADTALPIQIALGSKTAWRAVGTNTVLDRLKQTPDTPHGNES